MYCVVKKELQYSKEAVNLILSKQFLNSEGQLMSSRMINTWGRVGCKPCDLHMEYLNRRLKSILS